MGIERFVPTRRFELNQQNNIQKIANEILKVLKHYWDSPFEIPNILNQIANSPLFKKFTDSIARKLLSDTISFNNIASSQSFADNFTAVNNRRKFFEQEYYAKSLRIFKNLKNDVVLQKFINNKVEEKSELFKTIPKDLAEKIIPLINKWNVQGFTSKEMSKEKLFEHISSLLDYQVKTIARTETSKTSVEIIEFKAKKCNVPCYTWLASGGGKGDGRTRDSHKKMVDVIVFWNDPPAPEDLFPIIGENGQRYKNTLGKYHAGCCPNCRCIPSPVIFKDDLKFPVRVYTNGKIVSMQKPEFDNLYNSRISQMKAELQKKQESQKLEINKSQEELAKENRAKEEKDFLLKAEQRANTLIQNLKVYYSAIKNLENQLSKLDNNAIQSKIQELLSKIEKDKAELIQINNSIVISTVNVGYTQDINIISFLMPFAEELKKNIKIGIDNFKEIAELLKDINKKLTPDEIKKYTEDFNNLGVNNTFLDDMSQFVAQKMIKCMSNLFDKNPNLKGKIKSVGEIKTLYLHVKDDWIKEEVEKEQKEEKYKYIPFDEEEFKKRIDEKIQNELRLNDNKTNAYNLKLKEENEVNEEKKKHLKDLEGIYICSKESKGVNIFLIHPQDCNCVEGTINHELGHFLDDEYGIVEFLKEYFEKKYTTKKQINRILDNISKYVASIEDEEQKYQEFVAEIFSEMLTSKNPRKETVNIFQEIENKFNIRL